MQNMNNERNTQYQVIVLGGTSTNPHKRVRLKGYRMGPSILHIVLVFVATLTMALANRPPRFAIGGQSEIVLRLKESPETKVGSLIYTLKGFDPDDDPLTFGMKPSHDSEVIRIESAGKNEAHVYLAKELDRETQDEYSIVLTLTDNHYADYNYVTQSFLLLVDDINDNEPVFLAYQSAIEIPEDSGPGIITTLEALDADEGAFGQVVYYLQELESDNEGDIFSISTYQGKGILRLTGDLDYETQSLYQLRVLAVDRASHDAKTGTAGILVKVRDVEDNPPEFVEVQAVARVAEDAPVGAKVLRVRAIDGDRGINNPVRYHMEDNELFRIDEETGVVYTSRELDREDPHNQVNGAYILRVTATEVVQGSPVADRMHQVATEVTIIVTDVNDEIPTFSQPMYRCEINENAQTNTPLNFIDDEVRNFVRDNDVGNNGTFRLFLDPQNDVFEIVPAVAVNEATFMLRVKDSKAIDYEQMREINFTIFARELDEPTRWSAAHVQIFVRDQNDNSPVFSETIYNATIPENSELGTIVTRVEASDIDSGDFGSMGIRYMNLRGGIANLLHLNPISGVITIKQPGSAFDREIISRHYLTVEAIDNVGRGNRNTAQIIINIEDINDNPPTFVQRHYEAKLLENKEEFETPLQVEARDIDLNGTENSQITYEIMEGLYRGNFTINPETGLLRPARSFDFEELIEQKYNQRRGEEGKNVRPIDILVRARDSGIPMLSSVVPVFIYVEDVNDNPPIFQRNFYTKTIAEDMAGGMSILQVNAVDRDGSAPNNEVVYRIQMGAEDKFVINSETGVISVAQGANLDPDMTADKRSQYTLTVIALDGGLGKSQLMSSATVNLTIRDVNNKPPLLTDLPTIRVTENRPVGTVVYRVEAFDLDENPILRYHIDPANSEARNEDGAIVKASEYDFVGAFDLDPIDGTLTVAKILDREKVEHIKLAIVVEDLAAAKGKQVVEALLNVLVDDENDNNPRFRQPFYRRSITENSINGVLVATVVASDIDKNKTIRYSLEGNPLHTQLLHLDEHTGEIVVASRIDHEQYEWLNFTVRATDSGQPPRSALVDVFVTVLDENDNNPYFAGGSKNYTISEAAVVGTRVGQVQAADADSGDFGKITFLMDRISAQGKFSIDADTGVISVADVLDRESKDFYMLVIEAWDNYQFGFLAGESRNAFKQVFITILDANDNRPEVSLPTGCVLITEYHELPERIATVHGKDADDPSTPNGRLEFHITKGNRDDLFELRQVDPWTAHLFAKHSLRNRFGNHSLTISTRDLGSPPNTVASSLDICISDFNDHAPVFITPMRNSTIRIPENATVGSVILQVYATDADIGTNALVRYRLKPDPLGSYKLFEMHPDSGELVLCEPLDRSRQKIHELRIEAYDQGLPTSLSSDLDLTVYIRNVNEYEPQFVVEEIAVNFTEHADPGAERIKLPDTIDKDEVDDLDDPPSQVCYFIVAGNEEGYFRLHPESHVLTVERELDRELHANYTLFVKASENCALAEEMGPMNFSLPFTGATNRRSDVSEGNLRLRDMHSLNLRKRTFDYDRYKHSRSLRSVSEEADDEEPDYASMSSDELLLADSTIVRVFVRVLDINDNPPKFRSKVFTGGITTSADFGTTFMRVEAEDPDEGSNALIKYYQVGEIRQTLSEGFDREGLEQVRRAPFLVDADSGDIQLNFDPQRGMKGYFDFMVLANDSLGMKDVAHVFIYLLREDQKVRFVFRLQPNELREKIQLFKETLSNITESIVNIDEIKVHENKDGSVDKTKTDLYLHLVEREDNSIYEVSEVLGLIDSHIESLDGLFKELFLLDTQPAEAQLLTAGPRKGPMLVYLIFSNLFLVALLLVTLGLCASQRKGYRRQLRAAKVHIFRNSTLSLQNPPPEPGATRVPNTNKHSVQGSNPIWLKGYENEWFRNDENLSQGGNDSLDDNFLAVGPQNIQEALKGTAKLFNHTNDLNKHFNVYNQIDKLTNNAHILARKLETTEL